MLRSKLPCQSRRIIHIREKKEVVERNTKEEMTVERKRDLTEEGKDQGTPKIGVEEGTEKMKGVGGKRCKILQVHLMGAIIPLLP